MRNLEQECDREHMRTRRATMPIWKTVVPTKQVTQTLQFSTLPLQLSQYTFLSCCSTSSAHCSCISMRVKLHIWHSRLEVCTTALAGMLANTFASNQSQQVRSIISRQMQKPKQIYSFKLNLVFQNLFNQQKNNRKQFQ